MESNKKCDVCGRREFLVDAGYYYCQECGTQAKEIQEIQYELSQGFNTSRVHGKKVKRSCSSKSKEYKLTSWELYNYVLIGLVDELQKVGASEDFKLTTLQLWTSYLTSIEVAFTSKEENLIPKLPVVFKKDDAEILYGRLRKKRKRKVTNLDTSSVSLNHTSLDASLISKQRRLENKALVEAEYEALTGTQQSDINSILNSSFQTTKSSTSVTSNGYVQFNSSAKREQLRKMNRKHFNKHAKDQHSEMRCHKSKPSEKYLKSATFVTRNCLWAILYLALNITEDPIQLSDMIRFCREGHLSYFNLKHFIPEDYLYESSNYEILENAKYKIPNHNQIRTVAFKIAKMIKINLLKKPNIFMLCDRYCRELELPSFIAECAQKLSSANVSEIEDALSTDGCIPNYEGLALAYIIFILKLIFGLDGYSEYIISERVKILNIEFMKVDKNHLPIFCWDEWLYFIEYRKLLISQKHFPTHALLNSQGSIKGNIFIHFWNKVRLMDDVDDSKTAQLLVVMKKIFSDLKNLQSDNLEQLIFFEPSLTPFKDYFNLIQSISNDCVIPDSIKCYHRDTDFSFFINGGSNQINFFENNVLLNFKNESLNKKLFIWDAKEIENEFNDTSYKINRKDLVNIKSIGIMEWKVKLDEHFKEEKTLLDKVKETEKKSSSLKNKLHEINVMKFTSKQEIDLVKSAKFGGTVDIEKYQKLMIEEIKNLNKNSKNIAEKSKDKLDTNFEIQSKNYSLEDNTLRLGQKILPQIICKIKKKNNDRIVNVPRPVSCYWVNHFSNTVPITNTLFEKMESKFPSSFSLLLEESARIIEMTKCDLYKELIKVEQQFGIYQYPDRNRTTI